MTRRGIVGDHIGLSTAVLHRPHQLQDPLPLLVLFTCVDVALWVITLSPTLASGPAVHTCMSATSCNARCQCRPLEQVLSVLV